MDGTRHIERGEIQTERQRGGSEYIWRHRRAEKVEQRGFDTDRERGGGVGSEGSGKRRERETQKGTKRKGGGTKN